ncbi:MAG: hypothetical protein NZ853_03360 [Leptospiraceae bacterium]|nr:hypothetical protein [Leptospiraceae bacterium]
MKFQIHKLLSNLEGEILFKNSHLSIPFVVPGDIVEVKIQKRHAQLIKLERNSNFSHLVEPKCRYFSECGGCKGQHLDYPYQWGLKTQELKNYYQKEFSLKIEEVLPSQKYHYRNRMDFVVTEEKVGLRKLYDYNSIVDIEQCEIQSQEANEILLSFRNLLKEYPNLGYSRKLHQGVIKYITLRVGDSIFVILTINENYHHNEVLKQSYQNFLQKFIQKLKELQDQFQKTISLKECYTGTFSEVSNVLNGKVLLGMPYFEISFADLKFQIPPDSFFQPHTSVITQMMGKAIQFLRKTRALPSSISLMDLFCGVGTLLLLVYDRLSDTYSIKDMMGVEFSESSIAWAKVNFEYYLRSSPKMTSFEFQAKDLTKKLDIKPSENTVLILDPPRSGLHKNLINWIIKHQKQIRWILYLSCNPQKQKDEIEILKKFYQVKYIVFGDPFPHTAHWESLIVLQGHQLSK